MTPSMPNRPGSFNLIMISSEMEHGGNLTQRHFDGHPSCFTYPFESQLGTKFSRNLLVPAIHPVRYGYSEFPEGTTYDRAFDLLWDEELKAYLRNPVRSKFRDCGLIMSETARHERFLRYCHGVGETESLHDFLQSAQSYSPSSLLVKTRAKVVEAYFRSAFDAWENLKRSGMETHYVGYNPGMVADTDKILHDFPSAHIVHVVRNPWSAYGDYLKRPFPQQTLDEYLMAYNVAHGLAFNYVTKYPGRFHIVRLEDLLADKRATMEQLLTDLGLPWDDGILYPSFNGRELTHLPPWGTVEKPTAEYNLVMARQHDPAIQARITREAASVIELFGYGALGESL